MKLISELRRRNVIRMAAIYIVAAWGIMQVAEVMSGLANLPEWMGPTVLLMLAIGFPIALVFSWFYEITPEGIATDIDGTLGTVTGRQGSRLIDFVIIAFLCAAVILFAYDKWWISGPDDISIAVLPFENMSPEPDTEYFSDGISEELLNVLAQVRGLRVAARTSSFQFKGKDASIKDIGQSLNVSHVLEGSVRRVGNKVRITAQLIKVRDGFHLWSETYDRDLDDIFKVQDDIAGSIAQSLKLNLGAGARPAADAERIIDSAAYDLYLAGREAVHHRGGDFLQKAVLNFEHSLRLDASFAPAHAQLAIATLLMTQTNQLALEDASPTAASHLDQAQSLDPGLADAHAGRALLTLFTGDYEAAVEHAKKALEVQPNYSDALNWLRSAYLGLGQYTAAYEVQQRLLEADPLNIIGGFNYVEYLGLTGRPGEAHRHADRMMEADAGWAYIGHASTSLIYEGDIATGLYWGLLLGRESGHFGGYARIALAWLREFDEVRRLSNDPYIDVSTGELDKALRAAERALEIDPDNRGTLMLAGNVLFHARRFDEALPYLERAHEIGPDGRPLKGRIGHYGTMMLATARRHAGDEAGAQEAADIVRRDLAARAAAGYRNPNDDLAAADVAVFDGDHDRAVALISSSIDRGLRDWMVFENPLGDPLIDRPDYQALKARLETILEDEHRKALKLICFDNPVPDHWRPLPETCASVIPLG